MKRSIVALAAAALAAWGASALMQSARADDEPALALFKKNGCNECHSISALKVAKEEKKKPAEGEAAPAGEEAANKKKKDPPDLSGVGLEHDAKWISAYLNKQETKDGEKHEKRFKGTEAERRTLALWLGGLKHETKKAEEKKEGGQ